jgi:hypothetical protein
LLINYLAYGYFVSGARGTNNVKIVEKKLLIFSHENISFVNGAQGTNNVKLAEKKFGDI